MKRPALLSLLGLSVFACAAAPATREAASEKSPSPVAAPSATTSAAVPVTAPSNEAPAPAASAAAPTDEATCANVNGDAERRLNACERECRSLKPSACDYLGDLHSQRDGQPAPSAEAPAAVRAWTKACDVGVIVACGKAQHLLESLDQQCNSAPAERCVVAGEAQRQLTAREHLEWADARFQKACQAGSAEGCRRSGDLHADWDPESVHAPLALRSYEQSCKLRSADGCCALQRLYAAAGKEAQLKRVRKQLADIPNAKCADESPVGPATPVVAVVVELDRGTAAKFSDAEKSALKAELKRQGLDCYVRALQGGGRPTGEAEITIDVAHSGYVSVDALKLSALPRELAPCLYAAAREAEFEPATEPRSLKFKVIYKSAAKSSKH